MAVRKKTGFNIMNVVKATGGGAVAEVVMSLGAKYIPQVKNEPALGSLLPAIVGSAGLYFSKTRNNDAIYFGMLGASGGELADVLIGDKLDGLDGFSRVNYVIPENLPSQPMVTNSDVQGFTDEEMDMMEQDIDMMP
tara:strand:- start:496 stop:906 length:411 start_codon:yes stop_codon:yes gene_type:complete